MAFTVPLASTLSGASVSQLAYWRTSAVLVPEIEAVHPPLLYSFRDVVALRTFAWLRTDHSLQSIRKSLTTLRELDMVEHPSRYTLVKAGSSIAVVHTDGAVVDVAREPGQTVVGALSDVFGEFTTRQGRRVDPLRHPRANVEVDPARLGGWPTITGTRVPYDVVAQLLADGSVTPERIAEYYPGVSALAAREALEYWNTVHAA